MIETDVTLSFFILLDHIIANLHYFLLVILTEYIQNLLLQSLILVEITNCTRFQGMKLLSGLSQVLFFGVKNSFPLFKLIELKGLFVEIINLMIIILVLIIWRLPLLFVTIFLINQVDFHIISVILYFYIFINIFKLIYLSVCLLLYILL